jgi:ABC-2 type transport system permease protein
MLAYRVNFLIGASSTIAMQIGGLVTIWVVMRQVSSLHGWTLNEILLVYGLTNLALSFGHMFADNLWTMGRHYIRPGGFDRFLVRPINPLFALLADRFCYDGIGDFLVGLVVTIIAATGLGIAWTLPTVLYFCLTVVSGGAIFIALNLITSVSAFWIVDSVPVTLAVFQTSQFARYPLPIYASWIRILLTWVVPYGLVSFYPAAQLTGRNPGLMAWAPPVMAALLLGVGYRLWLFGLRHYTGTGS